MHVLDCSEASLDVHYVYLKCQCFAGHHVVGIQLDVVNGALNHQGHTIVGKLNNHALLEPTLTVTAAIHTDE